MLRMQIQATVKLYAIFSAGIFEDEFIEQRRESLEQFVNK